jgi:hypothetical protein
MAINFPDSPTDGQLTSAGGKTYKWDNTRSVWTYDTPLMLSSDTAPSNPVVGQLWFDTTVLKTFVYYNDGSSNQWVEINTSGTDGADGVSPNLSSIAEDVLPDTDSSRSLGSPTNKWKNLHASNITSGDHLPLTDSSYNLGSPTNKWKSLYISSNTLFLGDSGSISAGPGGGIEMGSLKIGSGAGAVELTASADGKLATKGTDASGNTEAAPSEAGAASSVTAMTDLVALTGMTTGQTALVTSLNRIFMYTGSGWFKIADMVNESPTAITGVNAAITLATDGTASVITAVSTDPEGFPLTWSYAVTTGSLGSTATVSQADNVFTITPSSTEADAGTFSITFSVTDGATGAVNAVSAFTLAFLYQFTTNTAPQFTGSMLLPSGNSYAKYFDSNPLPLGRHYFEFIANGRVTNNVTGLHLCRLDNLFTTQGGDRDPTTSPALHWAGHLGIRFNHPSSNGNGPQVTHWTGKHYNSSNGGGKMFTNAPGGNVYNNWHEWEGGQLFGRRFMVAYDTGNFTTVGGSGGNHLATTGARGAGVFFGLQGMWAQQYGNSNGNNSSSTPTNGWALDPNTLVNPQGGWAGGTPWGITGHLTNGYTYYTDADPFYLGMTTEYAYATSPNFTIYRGSTDCIYTLPTGYSYL